MAELLALGISGDPTSACPEGGSPIPDTSAPGLTARLIEDGTATEAVVFSAGHLTELYLVAEDALTAEASALAELSSCTGLAPSILAGSAYALEGDSAALHLFRIAAGLGCPAPGAPPAGEPIEKAHRIARDSGSAGPVLDRLFGEASEVATWARPEATTAAPLDELAVRRWERRLVEEAEKFTCWWADARDGEHPAGPDFDQATVAALLRFPRPGDAA